MRIAFLADPLDHQYGGIHVYTKELLRALSKINTNHNFLIVRSKTTDEFDEMEQIVLPYKTFPGYRFWRIFFQLPKMLTKEKVDMVVELAHFGPFNLPKRIKRVTVIHDMTVFLYPQYHVFWSQFLQRMFIPRIVKKANHIITNSANTTSDVVKYFPGSKHKVTSILLGKNKRFAPNVNVEVLRSYNLQKPYVLYVGTIEPRKNIKVLIEAFNTFKKNTGLPHQLVLIGKKGWKCNSIFEAINASSYKNDIVWLGYTDKSDLPVFYSMAEVFVYPSIYEGFGLPVLEAMASGTPVITSNTSSLPEVGDNAVVYVDPESADQLSQSMAALCTDTQMNKEYADRGIAQASKFTWENTAQAYINLFNSIS